MVDLTVIGKEIMGFCEEGGGTWGVVVEHAESGERFVWQPDRLFQAASVIKLPVLSAVFHEQAKGTLHLHEMVELRLEDQVNGSGVLKLFTPGIALPILDLATLMITVSDNTATNLLIDRMGIETINAHMRDDGLRSSVLRNPLQRAAGGFNGRNEITAEDIALWLRKVVDGTLVSHIASRRMIDILKAQQYQNKIPGILPDPENGPAGMLPLWQFANKTGMVKNIEHDAGILYLRGATFLVVTLAHQSSGAIPAMQKIGRSIYDGWYGLRP